LEPKAYFGLTLRSGVVLKGHSAADTKLIFGPAATKTIGSTQYTPFYWPAGTQRSGIADLAITNIDKTSQAVVNASSGGGNVSKLFIARVNWDLGTGRQIALAGDRIAIVNSNFRQAANTQFPLSNGASGIGPLYLTGISNFTFRNNIVAWASGQNSMNELTNAVIESNHFTRVADQIVAGQQQTSWPSVAKPITVGALVQRSQGRQLSINFGKNLVIHSNIFDTAGNAHKYNWADGETILSEGGGPKHRADTGVTTSATALTVADDSRCCSWNYYPNSIVSIVTGKGAGQLRHIVGRNNNTFTVDQPWDIIPSPGDHFAIDTPSFENALIRFNTMSNNPAGIILYGGSFLDVSIAGNNLTNNGGIYLRPDQRTPPSYWNKTPASFFFERIRNIDIIGNNVINTKALYGAYIATEFALVSPNTLWGASADGVRIIGNKITALAGTPTYYSPEGYANKVAYQNPTTPYLDQGLAAITGTVFQGNSCTNCPVNYTVSTAVLDTVIWNATTTNNPGVQSTFLVDKTISSGTPKVSIGTIVGHD
jgi:hypothetical protein